jgi:hypothetical protein
MARNLGRTPTSINKALSRFEIRTPRKYIEKPQKHHPSKTYIKEPEKRFSKIEWTPFKQILSWLKTIGHDISVTKERQHLVDKKPMSTLQILMLANQLRLQRNEEIFLVENVTW